MRTWLLCRVELEEGHWAESVTYAVDTVPETIKQPAGAANSAGLRQAREAHQKDPGNAQAARELLERLYALPPEERDVALIRAVIERGAGTARALWILFDTERALGLERPAAETGVRLAGLLAGQR